jgi:hypothetical protein
MAKVDALFCYQYFHSVKLHFKQKKYDFRKYGLNKSKFDLDKFKNDNGRSLFVKLSETYDEETIKDLININLFINPEIWVTDLLEKAAWDNYLWWKKYHDSRKTYFLVDVKYLREKYGAVNQADLFKEIMGMKIHPDTVSLLARFSPLLRENCLKSRGIVVYEAVYDRLLKWDAFVVVPNVEYLSGLKELLRRLYSKEKK